MRPRARNTIVQQWIGLRTYSSPATARRSIEDHDIVILGGGPAGLALTAALASSKSISSTNKLTLLEASSLSPAISNWTPTSSTQYSNRVSSITNTNAQFLASIRVWQHLDQSRIRPIDEIQVWDGISDARLVFDNEESNHDSLQDSGSVQATGQHQPPRAMATLLENLNLQRASWDALEQHRQSNAQLDLQILDGRKVISIEMDEVSGWPLIELGPNKSGEPARTLRARLLIGADGYNSPVKAYSQIDTFGWPYDATGIVASMHVAPEKLGEGMSTMWQRFLPEGPIAFLPLSDTSVSLVWSTTPTLARAIKALPAALLPDLINAAFATPYPVFSQVLELLKDSSMSNDTKQLEAALAALDPANIAATSTYDPSAVPDMLPPRVTAVDGSSVAAFPLRLSHTSSYIGMPVHGRDRRTALVGDAAHTIHPLAGQGLNMGLGDVEALVGVLEETAQKGGDVGAYTALRAYPRSRYIPNHALLSTCDHLFSLYRSQNPLITWARSTGLETINELTPLKKLFMAGAGANASTVRGGDRGRANRSRGVGAWGVVADGIETVRGGIKVASALGGFVLGQVKQRVGSVAAVAATSASNGSSAEAFSSTRRRMDDDVVVMSTPSSVVRPSPTAAPPSVHHPPPSTSAAPPPPPPASAPLTDTPTNRSI